MRKDQIPDGTDPAVVAAIEAWPQIDLAAEKLGQLHGGGIYQAAGQIQLQIDNPPFSVATGYTILTGYLIGVLAAVDRHESMAGNKGAMALLETYEAIIPALDELKAAMISATVGLKEMAKG